MKKSAAYFGLFSFGNRIRLREWNWKMESGANTKEVLTPKNVYRFLTDNLPGLYPHGVIPAAERKGLTLVKFWAQVLDGIIPPEWHASLFAGSQRSRRLSDMMNRTGVQPLPPKLQQEMNALLSGETLIRLSQQVQDFLRSAHYDADALTRALPDFVRMMMENEECMKPEHEQVFENLQQSRETLPRTFVDMLTLSWLVLLAFYGPEMGSRELLDFCHAQEHSAQALYLLSSHVTFGRRVPLSMTGRNCELCRQGLSKDEYVMDAASCLPQLTDAIRQGGKIAVTGMGGIGKTEMTRQALAVLAKEELFSRMAWVQYEKSLTASLRMAFDGLDGVAEENVLSTVREKLEAPYQGRTLLLIDSVDMPPEADEGLRLAGGKFSAIAQKIAQMVSTDALTDRERQVLAVFATFPAWTIPVRDALTLLRDFGTEDELLSALETAADYGLLTSNWRGYAMHPVLAESFRPLLPPMEKVPRLAEVFEECKAHYRETDYRTAPLMSLALYAISDFDDAPVEVMGGMTVAIFYLLNLHGGEIPAARLELWRQKKQGELQKTEHGRFLDGCFSLALDSILGGDLVKDGEKVIANLSSACEDDIEFMLLTCGNQAQQMERENTSKFLARIGELIPLNHPNAAAMRAEKTAIALLNKESVPQEDLDAAISCFMEALDEPKRVVDAAGQLAQVLCAMGLAGMPRERIKALAELLEEKTKDVDNLPFAFYEGCELVFHILEEYDKALSYAKAAVEHTPKNTKTYFTALYNYVTIMQEMGRRLETQETVVDALKKVQKLFGENNSLFCCFKMAYISNLLELKQGKEANEALNQVLPIVRQQMGEIDAKVVESARVRALALLGREEEAIELGKQVRAFFVQIGGEEWTQVKALDRIISKVKKGGYRQET